MDYGVKGKVALVGGASRGIGRAIAEALAREGAKVAICARDESAVKKTAEAILDATGAEVAGFQADLANGDDVYRVLDNTWSRLGEIDILVTNTGGPRPGRFTDLEGEDWDDAFELLVRSTIRLIKGVLPAMKERRWGRIIGITSVSVKEPIDNLLLSNVYRTGVTSLFKSLAGEVASHNITVNTVLPGLTDTERLRALYSAQAKSAGMTTDEFIAKAATKLPRQRLNSPEECAALVAFLASQAASGITGCAIPVDGGQLKNLM